MTLEEKVEILPRSRCESLRLDCASRFVTPATLAGIFVALIAAAMVYVSLESAPGIIGLLGAALAVVTLAIAVSDWRSFIIPDWLSLAGGGLALLHAAAQEPGAMVQAVALAVFRGLVLASFFSRCATGMRDTAGARARIGGRQARLCCGCLARLVNIAARNSSGGVSTLSACIVRHFVSHQRLSPVSRMPFGLFFAPASGSAGY